ncbi:MAG: glycosyltransferase [Actinomycetota bacterium]|nr:glycosyltransferase [Actinomycetota bacterium]
MPARPRLAPVIDAVIPARDEAPTVAAVVAAVKGCPSVREVIVVDDGSGDDTAERAAAAGAKVVDHHPGGSKARAMEAGVDATDADAILFVDADLTGLTSAHLDDICRPFLEGRAVMSLGTFDYGPRWNWLVLRFPPTTGERIVPRWVFDSVPPHKRDGYTIEVMLNEVIAEGHLPTTARVMEGVFHRTKREKFGWLAGTRLTWRMFWQLVGLPVRGVVRWRTYWFYLRELTVE